MRTPTLFAAAALALFACAAPEPRPVSEDARVLISEVGRVELVETVPLETDLGVGFAATHETWLDMIGGARERIDLASFYASNAPGSRLEQVVRALEAAADRGVEVRFLADERFYGTYPQTLDRLARAGVQVRRLDLGELTGGVLHAKYLVVDGRDAYVGSANFDWRSLAHIVELGVRVRSRAVGTCLGDVFAWDWKLAGGTAVADLPPPHALRAWPQTCLLDGGERILVTPVFSPRGLLPHPESWDLPRLIAWIDAAETTLDLQFLNYKAIDRDGAYFPDLEDALRSAAARGVAVRLLVAHWSLSRGTVEGLQSLACLPGIEVRYLTVPEASTGFEPFSRVLHAKQIVVDGRRVWIGSSNAQADYFEKSRNVGLLLEGAAVGARAAAFFERAWSSPYTAPIEPGRDYPAPRVAR